MPEEEKLTREEKRLYNRRDVIVRPEGGHLVLSIGKEERRVSYTEAAGLLESLIKHVPGIPDAVEVAYSIRHAPTCTIHIIHRYDREQQKVRPMRFRATLSISGHVITQSNLQPTIEEAEAELARVYGSNEWDVTLYQDCLISIKKAGDEQVFHQAELYCEREGITMQELWKRMRAG